MIAIQNIYKKAFFLIFSLTSTLQAVMVPYQEDAYLKQAPENLVTLLEKVAQAIEFNSNYEVISPTKAGIEINPWNKFIAHGINPITKNPLIVINPEWFSSLPDDQQLFLIGRCLMYLKQGAIPPSYTVLWYIFAAISVLTILLSIWLMSKTSLKNQSFWVRMLLAVLIAVGCEFALFDPLQERVKRYLGMSYDQNIHERVMQKLSSKDTAIKALEHFDASIKQEVKNGNMFFVPYVNLFEGYAQNLKKS